MNNPELSCTYLFILSHGSLGYKMRMLWMNGIKNTLKFWTLCGCQNFLTGIKDSTNCKLWNPIYRCPPLGSSYALSNLICGLSGQFNDTYFEMLGKYERASVPAEYRCPQPHLFCAQAKLSECRLRLGLCLSLLSWVCRRLSYALCGTLTFTYT